MVSYKYLTPLALTSLLFMQGCAQSPKEVRPSLAQALPETFAQDPNWKPAAPIDDKVRKNWWEIFQDEGLNALEVKVITANQTVAQAVANYDAERAMVAGSRAAFLPSITASGSSNATGATLSSAANKYAATIGGTWELDLFGNLRANLKQQIRTTQASRADLGNALLAAQGELALDYIQLRALDAQRDAQAEAVAGYTRSLNITQNRYKAGVSAALDVAQAKSLLESTQAGLTELNRQRDVLEHAIAVLVGENPSQFQLKAVTWVPSVPAVPAMLPSQLLERRPDIAGNERRVYAAGSGIGAARTAFFPIMSLNGSVSSTGNLLSQLFSAPTSLWAWGFSAAETVFNGGARLSKVNQANAKYRQAVAAYRQNALTAFQQVEDNLAGVRYYALEEQQRKSAYGAASAAERISLNQYKAGTVDYTTVVTAQTSALTARQSAITATSKRLQSAVSLIQALGGGWQEEGLEK
jgi:NodT family efflux transporter outer membrane factor (OMF) lipoprotein